MWEDAGAVVDHSDGRGLLRLRGPRLVETLAKSLDSDQHPHAFPMSGPALSAILHLPVLVWKRSEAPVFELLTQRPAAAGTWYWPQEPAAEFGIEVEEDIA